MRDSLTLAPQAELDIGEAYEWYESHRAGLGEEFLQSVYLCLKAIADNSGMYPQVDRSYRRALVRRFPYGVFYEAEGNTVTVYGVFHTARDPSKWRRRLP